MNAPIESSSTVDFSPRLSNQAQRVAPSNPFVEFRREEIEMSIPARFEQQVRTYANRTAVKSRHQSLSYEELNRAANRVARTIIAQQLMAETPVALLLENDAPMIVSILGTLKAERPYLPIDISLPQYRISTFLEDSKAELILTNHRNLALATKFALGERRVLNIDSTEHSVSTENVGLPISPDSAAYIMYTSGSTGRPKGVIQSHRNVLHMIMGFTNSHHICPDDQIALLSSSAFLIGVQNVFGALLNGAAVVPFSIMEEGLGAMAQWLIQERITIFNTVPTLYRHFVETLDGRQTFPDLRIINLGGETVSRRDIDLYKKYFSPNCIIVNGLGTTETGSIRRYFVAHETIIAESNVPVGYPIEDHEIELLNDDDRQVGVGRVGEIVVKSRYLSPGYWRRPDLTAAAFQPDPEDADRRIYRTGDLGRMRPDGCLEHLGRKDLQVKVRGHRVEVVEIELALLKLDNIREAVVVARKDRSGDQRLVAFLVTYRHPPPTVSELRHALSENLADYMIPSVFVYLNALPLTQTGKVDRQALPMPDSFRPILDSVFVGAWDDMERRLIDIWEQILGIDTIGVHDNFFELGGDSLHAASLLIQIKKVFGATLPLATVFQRPTVEQLAQILRQGINPSSSWSMVIQIQPGGSIPPFFCVAGVSTLNVMARYLDQEQPVYALAPLSLEDLQTSYTRVEQIATYYLQGIRAVQSEGPYLLGGHSFGGLVAFEMAQQLWAQGQAVQLVVLFDTYPARPQRALSYYYHRMRHFIENGQLIDKLVYQFKKRLPRLLSPEERNNERFWACIARATNAYTIRPYSGRIVFFEASETQAPLGTFRDTRLEWAEVALNGLETHQVPGDHSSMLGEPHIQILAEKLRACLKDVNPVRTIG